MAPQKVTKVLCIGAGYVGGPTCAVIALKCPHIQVTIVDLNQARIDAWNSPDFKLPIYEPGLEDVVRACRGRNLFFSTDVEKGIQGGGAHLSTSSWRRGRLRRWRHRPRLSSKSPLCRAALPSRCALSSRQTPSPTAASIFSLTPSSLLRAPPSPTFSSLTASSSAPFRPPEGKDACAALAAIYANWVPTENILTVGLWSSELSKLAANAMLAQRISSINALSAICEATGANIDEVANAVGYDSRVGPKFLKASVGFGGSCFQKDILNLVYLSESLHLPEVAAYWRQVVEMNEYQKRRFSKRVVDTLFNTITGKRIAVLGFAFKADTGDTRESAAITLIRDFQSERAFVNIYDPQVVPEQIWLDLDEASPSVPLDNIKKQVRICGSALEACKDAEAVVIATEWKEFREIDWSEVYKHMKKPAFVFDGRLIVDAKKLTEIGFKVTTIGRPALG
ncbi:UDP-glucose 6-dehydrogenase [Mycena venus]|uniref:UDP-glucose 6-dehydrogenase n=1 Tax=Mycena venus TaxID=2733690 RepID=A0A8H6X5B0_9AGAR|nr:UDP-glucose 6-dehydrogenase [Mycena venus]